MFVTHSCTEYSNRMHHDEFVKTINTIEFEIPTICPLCNKILVPRIDYAETIECEEKTIYSAILFCPHCQDTFFIYGSDENDDQFTLEAVYPVLHQKIDFDSLISKISPNFVEIYNQAYEAEEQNLNHITGMGYRKALEFLVKDYCIHKFPDETPDIRLEPLSKTIRRINDNRIQTLCSRASWLGNDECHYTKKHTNKDIQDMKNFIQTAIHFIQDEKILEEACNMQPK